MDKQIDTEELDIDHEFTDEIVCPHCGCEHGDSWEEPDEGENECMECGKLFKFERNYEITYVTSKVGEER